MSQWPYSQYTASLSPPDTRQMAASPQVQWYQTPLYFPNPLMPYAENIAQQGRDYVTMLSTADTNGLVLNTEVFRNVRFDTPGVAYAATAAARRTDGSAFPVGWDPLDSFDVSMVYGTGDKLVTQAGMGSAIFGTAARPRWFCGPAWCFDVATIVQLGLTARLSNLQVCVSFWYMERRGPTNVNAR